MSTVNNSSSNPPPKGDDRTMITDLREVISARSTGESKAYLTVIAGPQSGEMIPIEKETLVMGRDDECDLKILDSGISRTHARVSRVDDTTFSIEDMNSTNGVFIDGVRIKIYQLREGDRIQVGASTIIKFSMHDEVEVSFQEQLYQSAVKDGLTGVYNRQYFDERLREEFSFSFRHLRPLALIMIDIDFFKKVNDTYGHPTGDLVLKVLSNTLLRIIRNEDILCRYGGEEFAIIVRGTDKMNVDILAERIRVAIEELLIPIDDGELRITISVGLAGMMNREFDTAQDMINAADKALYEAKEGGRNKVVSA